MREQFKKEADATRGVSVQFSECFKTILPGF